MRTMSLTLFFVSTLGLIGCGPTKEDMAKLDKKIDTVEEKRKADTDSGSKKVKQLTEVADAHQTKITKLQKGLETETKERQDADEKNVQRYADINSKVDSLPERIINAADALRRARGEDSTDPTPTSDPGKPSPRRGNALSKPADKVAKTLSPDEYKEFLETTIEETNELLRFLKDLVENKPRNSEANQWIRVLEHQLKTLTSEDMMVAQLIREGKEDRFNPAPRWTKKPPPAGTLHNRLPFNKTGILFSY